MLPMLKTVLSSVFKKSATVLYPLEKKAQPAGMRGLVVNNIEQCIFCNICRTKCPTGAIKVDRIEKTWAIARYDCVQCGNCVLTCPRKCLEMSPERPEAVTKKVIHSFRPQRVDDNE